MRCLKYTPVGSCNYAGIISILDYETTLKGCLSEFYLPNPTRKPVLVDTALKTGLSDKRFLTFIVSSDRSICYGTAKIVKVPKTIENLANSILSTERDSVLHSVLPPSQKQKLRLRNSAGNTAV